MWGTTEQLTIMEILGIPDPTNFLPVEETVTVVFWSLAAIVIHFFSFGKLNKFVEVKFEGCYTEPEKHFINDKKETIKSTDQWSLQDLNCV